MICLTMCEPTNPVDPVIRMFKTLIKCCLLLFVYSMYISMSKLGFRNVACRFHNILRAAIICPRGQHLLWT